MNKQVLPPLLAVVGQTAVGKSALALSLTEVFEGEIVTADSRQVYKYMDVGTDKPSIGDRQRVAHHLIDLVEPDVAFTLADYQALAYNVIAGVTGRGGLPILAGGTPLYANAVLEGWTIPQVEPDMELRAELEAEAEQTNPNLLHARLAELDPQAASTILPSNTRRIVRALEVITRTGKPISAQQGRTAPPYRILRLGLACDRTELYRRIDARVDLQIERGLVDEVRSLHDRGYAFDLRSMSGIGYRQIGAYLQGTATLEEAIQRIKWDTHSFARHQANWFQRAVDTVWLDATDNDRLEKAVDIVKSWLKQ
ncbi:MAG: tRNA (adenosine(37)-N6)-dimethylallyltransferase MiaA [Chloroflexia bacterium]